MSLPAWAKIPVRGAMKPTLIVSAAHAVSAPPATHEASASAASVLTSLELLHRAMSDLLGLCARQAVAGLEPHPPRRGFRVMRGRRARARGGRGDPAIAAPAPELPPSPTPFTPSGFRGVGVSSRIFTIVPSGISIAVGIR